MSIAFGPSAFCVAKLLDGTQCRIIMTSIASNPNDPYFLLIYKAAENYIEKRAPYRKEHLELIQRLAQKGYVILGGATENPADEAYICFQCPSRETVENFVKQDPYVKHGAIVSHQIREWKVVVGTACKKPLQAEDLPAS